MVDPLELALGYPYPHPEGSFVYVSGRVVLLEGPPPPDLFAGRVAVLAHGSNRAPEQLDRKFRDHPGGVEIPTLRAELRGYDVVYGDLFARYGSVPATLIESPGTVVDTHVQLLTPELLEAMHRTEGAYSFVAGYVVTTDTGTELSASAYVADAGPLRLDGAPVSLAEVLATGRVFPDLTQREVQLRLRDRLSPAMSLETFIRSNLS